MQTAGHEEKPKPGDGRSSWGGGPVEDPSTAIRQEDFIIQDGIRLVKPYYFDFIANVKQRWSDKTLVDLFSEEFPQCPRSYYEEAVLQGRLRIEGRKVGVNHIAKNGQKCRHFVHRHEPPVIATEIEVVKVTEDVVAVNKPHSMPVHVAGQYRKNTLLGILQATRPDLGILHSCHRLDKGVSGLLVLARSASAANQLRRHIEAGDVCKVYVARVLGTFPEGEVKDDTPLLWDPKTNRASWATADTEGKTKAACTHFKRLHVAQDGLTSAVECRPQTGRTHQIRVHLQHLGHPIANDAQYGGTYSGPTALKRSLPAIEAAPRDTTAGKRLCVASEGSNSSSQGLSGPRQQKADAEGASEEVTAGADRLGSSRVPGEEGFAGAAGSGGPASDSAPQFPMQVAGLLVDELCRHCPSITPLGYPTDLRPLWLHALSYKFGDVGESYTTAPPIWASQHYVPT
mmetsp:Transcript_30976/g.87755  ORF Transcript_30976/g.87755 Transcript_30976/m.87755 type:complete len:457 (-) Transcript_30976:469-1839(-)